MWVNTQTSEYSTDLFNMWVNTQTSEYSTDLFNMWVNVTYILVEHAVDQVAHLMTHLKH